MTDTPHLPSPAHAEDPVALLDPAMRLRHIGLTGGIGSGKSTVAGMLVACGAVLVDTDAIARQLTAPGGRALPALIQAFGPDIVGADRALNRDRMRQLAFGDAQHKALLESILHPMIGAEAQALAHAAGPAAYVVFDVPLLSASSHWRARVHRVLVVDCSEATQRARVVARNGWPPEVVDKVMAQQASRTQRRRLADAVIYNDGLGLTQLRAEVQALWADWTHPRATQPAHPAPQAGPEDTA
jgi:dephospho-CoA kinase